MAARANFGEGDPFETYLNFGVFVNVSGGLLLEAQNNTTLQIEKALALGTRSYKLTYQPYDAGADEQFRRIHVSLRNPEFRTMNQAGYFKADEHEPAVLQKDIIANLTEVARSNLTYGALTLSLQHVVRHPDTNTAELTVLLSLEHSTWTPVTGGKSTTSYRVAVASLNSTREILRSKLETLDSTVPTQERHRLDRAVTMVTEVIQIPKNGNDFRVVIEDTGNGRIGSLDIDQAGLKDAPSTPTPQPKLVPHT